MAANQQQTDPNDPNAPPPEDDPLSNQIAQDYIDPYAAPPTRASRPAIQPTTDANQPGGAGDPGESRNAPPTNHTQPYPIQPAAATAASYNPANQRQVEDNFFQTLMGGGFSSGASSRGAGFFSGGNAYRNNLQTIADAFNKQHPGAQAKAVGDDKIDFGDGRGPQDVITEGGDFWYGGGGAGAGGQGGMGAPGAAGNVGASGTAGSGNPQLDALIEQQILSMLQKGSQPVTEADVMAQYAPVSRTFQRARDQAKAASAQRLAYGAGTNRSGEGGELDSEAAKIDESYAGNEGKLMAGLIGDELKARRQQAVDALQYAQGEKKIALQMQIAQLDNAIRQQQVGLQSRSIDQQNQQFYDNLGYQVGRDAMVFNQNYGNGLGG